MNNFFFFCSPSGNEQLQTNSTSNEKKILYTVLNVSKLIYGTEIGNSENTRCGVENYPPALTTAGFGIRVLLNDFATTKIEIF